MFMFSSRSQGSDGETFNLFSQYFLFKKEMTRTRLGGQVTNEHVFSHLSQMNELKNFLHGTFTLSTQKGHDRKQLNLTFLLFHLFLLARHIRSDPDIVKRDGYGTDAPRFVVDWLRDRDIVLVFSRRVIARVSLECLFVGSSSSHNAQVRLEAYPHDWRITNNISTNVSLFETGDDLSQELMGFLFWCNHEFILDAIEVRERPASYQKRTWTIVDQTPLQDYLYSTVYSHLPQLHDIVYHEFKQDMKGFKQFLRGCKRALQDRLREDDFLRHALAFFRSWHGVRQKPKQSADVYQTYITQHLSL